MSFREPPAETTQAVEILKLPCGNCIGCRVRKARDWALRCCLEASLHEDTAFVTLTYDDDHIPPDGLISKAHLSSWLKRVRARLHPRRVRFYACGEYGEATRRPHYHALLFGVSDHPSLQECWTDGFVRVDPCTPASISYVAGYVGKKIGDPSFVPKTVVHDLVDAETGEYLGQRFEKVKDPHAPFRLMSRRPGIGGLLRNDWRAWRESAIWRGREVPVPRFLHAAWALNASPDEIIELENKKRAEIVARDINRERLLAGEKIAGSLQSIKEESRTL